MSDRAPDLIERVVGFRSFKLRRGYDEGDEMVLVAPYKKTVWRGVMEAACYGNHQAPDAECGCGLYGLWTPHGAAGYSNDSAVRVIAGCTFWGRMRVHSTGVRAQFAEVHAVHLFGGGVEMSPGMRALARADPAYFQATYVDVPGPTIGDRLGLIECDFDSLEMVTMEFGAKLPAHMRPDPRAEDFRP